MRVETPHCGSPPKLIQPLVARAEAWQAIPGVSYWVLGIIKWGYSLQFAQRLPWFSGVVSTSVQSKSAHVLRAEVKNLLAKGAVKTDAPAQSKSGLYSRYFLIPKKGGSLRPILDSEPHPHETAIQNEYSETDPITNSPRRLVLFAGSDGRLLSHTDSHHKLFLRFAFKGVAYQYIVLSFGLSLALRTLTKCIDMALSPLRQVGVRILNYIDDWLILTQSEA